MIQKPRKLVFKYTVKIPTTNKIEIHYVAAYTEELAREGLSRAINVDPSILRLSNRNLPWTVRAAIADPTNTEYFLTIDVRIKPLQRTSIKEQQIQHFDLKSSLIASLKYNVQALARQDKDLLLKYSEPLPLEHYNAYERNELADYFTYGLQAHEKAYEDLRQTILKEGLEDLQFDDGHYVLDILDGCLHSISISPANYSKLVKARFESKL